MVKTLLSFLCVVFVLSACNMYNEKNYKKYRGISYEQYEREQNQKDADNIGSMGLDVSESDIAAPSFENAPEDIDSEVIESTNSSYGEAVVVMASKKIALNSDATSSDLQLFQTALDAAYKTAMLQYGASGFTYAISPAGTVNPLAVIDVQCVLSESSADATGKATCDLFFKEIPVEYQNLKDAK